MSGPKSYYVSVEEQERRRREEKNLCISSCKGFIDKLQRYKAELVELDIEDKVRLSSKFNLLEESASLEAWQSLRRKLAKAADVACGAIAAERRRLYEIELMRQRRERVLSYFSARKHSDERFDAFSLGDSGSSQFAIGGSLSAEVKRITDVLSKLENAQMRTEFMAAAQDVMEVEDEELAEFKLSSLKNQVYEELQAQGYRELANDSILNMGDLDDLPDQDAEKARRLAQAVRTAEDLEVVRNLVDIVISRRRDRECAQEKTAFVQNALEEVLDSMGYEIGERFEVTEFGPVAFVGLEERPGHAVRIQVTKSGDILTRVVSSVDSNASYDAMVEEESCSLVHEVMTNLRGKGIGVELSSEHKPGEIPVEHLNRGAFKANGAIARNRLTRRGRKRERTA